MKNIIFAIIFSFLLLTPVYQAAAQDSALEGSSSGAFDTTGFPQWAKDVRRWEIVAFGTFPFSMFFVTFFTDLHRWNAANGMSMSDRRYAPWPLKSAGPVEMTKQEYERTILLAAGLSMTLAFTDLIIVKVKQRKLQRRLESMPSGSFAVDITRPYAEEEEIEALEDEAGDDDSGIE